MNTLAAMRERIPEVQLVRALAILAVLFVHSSSYATLQMTHSSYYVFYNFINIFMRFGTPVFICLSSFVLFYGYYSRPFTKETLLRFYKKRLLYIILPYVIFSVIYYVLMHYMYYRDRSFEQSLWVFIVQLSTGKAYTHLYFVFISCQFYLVFPLFLLLFKAKPLLAKWALPIGLAVQWGFVEMNKYYFQVPNKGSWALSYFGYFMLGATLGIFYLSLKRWLLLSRQGLDLQKLLVWVLVWSVWVAAGVAHAYIWYNARKHGVQYNTSLYELLWNVQTFMAAIVCFQMAFLLYRKLPQKAVRILDRLGMLSFGIYFIHPLFLLIYRQFPPDPSHPWLFHFWYAGGYVLALGGSWLVVAAMTRLIPFAWIFYGRTATQDRGIGVS